MYWQEPFLRVPLGKKYKERIKLCRWGGVIYELIPVHSRCVFMQQGLVAVNVSPLLANKYKMNIVSIAMRSYHFMFRANTFPEREKADLLIEPYNLEGYNNTELEKAEEIFMQGYNAANTLLDQLKVDRGSIWKDESNYQIIK